MAGEIRETEQGERLHFAVPPLAADAAPAQPSPQEAAPRFVPANDPGLPSARWAALRAVRVRSAFGEALALEIERGTPFLFVPVFLGAGALAYFLLPFEPNGLVLTGLLLGAAAAAWLGAPWRPLLYGAMPILLVLAGVGLAKTEAWLAGTKMLAGTVSTTVTGRVVAVDLMPSGRARLTIDVTQTQNPTLRYSPQRVRLSARSLPPDLAVGDAVSGLARLQAASGPVRPGSYDFSFQSYFEGIGATGFFMRDPVRVAAAEPGFWRGLLDRVEDARDRAADHIRQRIGGAEGEIAAALMVGARAGIPGPANEALRRSGLYHIISISGLHMALVAGAVMAALRIGLALLPGFAARRPAKKYAAAAAILAIGLYLFISGNQVAAERSFIMLAIMLAAVLFDRRALSMRNLALSALVVLVMTPHEVAGPSFQMSFAATAALVAAYALWAERRAARPPRAPEPHTVAGQMMRRAGSFAFGLVMTSLVAGFATAAFAAYHFQRVAPLSLAANLAVTPIVSLIVVPSAIFAALAMPFGADGLFLDAMGFGLRAMMAVARWFSERTPLDAVGLVSGRAVVLLTVALVIATMATTWLRAAAVPFAVAGIVLLPQADAPDMLISDDGRMIAMAAAGGAMAVDRRSSDSFTAENWKRALGATRLLQPRRQDDAGRDPPGEQFACDAHLCVAMHASGAVIVHAADVASAIEACGYAKLIVLDDATVPLRCSDDGIAVVTRRDLARLGSAAVTFSRDSPDARPDVVFALAGDGRPWHSQRAFSREARGLASYKSRKERPAAKAPASGSTLPGSTPAAFAPAAGETQPEAAREPQDQ